MVQTGSECPQLVIYFIFFPVVLTQTLITRAHEMTQGDAKLREKRKKASTLMDDFFIYLFFGMFFSPLKLCVCVHVCVCDCVRACFKGPFHLRSTS